MIVVFSRPYTYWIASLTTWGFLRKFHLKRRPADVIAPGKIPRAGDVCLMFARWQTELHEKIPNDGRNNPE